MTLRNGIPQTDCWRRADWVLACTHLHSDCRCHGWGEHLQICSQHPRLGGSVPVIPQTDRPFPVCAILQTRRRRPQSDCVEHVALQTSRRQGPSCAILQIRYLRRAQVCPEIRANQIGCHQGPENVNLGHEVPQIERWGPRSEALETVDRRTDCFGRSDGVPAYWVLRSDCSGPDCGTLGDESLQIEKFLLGLTMLHHDRPYHERPDPGRQWSRTETWSR